MFLRRKCSISLLHNADNVQLLDRSWMGAGVLPLLIRVDCKAFCTVLQINALEKKAETVAFCVHVCKRVPCHTFELLHATFRPQSHSCRSCAIHQTRDNRPPTQQIVGNWLGKRKNERTKERKNERTKATKHNKQYSARASHSRHYRYTPSNMSAI